MRLEDLQAGSRVLIDSTIFVYHVGIEVASLGLDTVLRSAELRTKYGLMVNDSLLCAAALAASTDAVASADKDFERVEELAVYRPGDLA